MLVSVDNLMVITSSQYAETRKKKTDDGILQLYHELPKFCLTHNNVML